MSYALTILLDGVAYGMILFIISVGLTVTMGLMRVVNLAHGAFAMVGGYVAAELTGAGYSFFVAVVIGSIAAGVVGGACEMTVFRPLYRKGELAQVLMTIGLVFVAIAALTMVFGTNFRSIQLPPWLEQTVDIGFRNYPAYRLFLIATGSVLAFFLWLLIDRSLFGARIRAAVDNPHMARAVGIDVNRLFTITFIGGSALAGFGGAIGVGMLPLEAFYPLRYLVLFLVVVIVGGEGSFKGSFVAAIVLGLIETAGTFTVPTYSSFILYSAVFILLLWRPNGLLPPKSAS
ncbi:MAG: branched-chain amino acid ABC transporter permease [Rhodospirillales bacterium]|nr:branched-chain amino acid ABC transporter permease [Rhodospirillales bacterium]